MRLHEILFLVFEHVSYSKLDLLLSSSHETKDIVWKLMGERFSRTRLAFEKVSDTLCGWIGSERDTNTTCLRKAFEGYSDGKPVIFIDIRLNVRLVRDRLEIEAIEERGTNGAYGGTNVSMRRDTLTIWPCENLMRRNRNHNVEPVILEELDLDALTYPRPDCPGLKCVTSELYGFN
jgi:hypothetical protein